MRHIPEQLLHPLLGILDDAERQARAVPKLKGKEFTRLYYIENIRLKLLKKYPK